MARTTNDEDSPPTTSGRRPGGITLFFLSGAEIVDKLLHRRRAPDVEPSVRGVMSEDGRTRSAKAVVTIRRSPADVYRFFREFSNFPRFMAHLESVETDLSGRSRWAVRTVAGAAVRWEAEIVEERPGELLLWRSLPGADVDNRGVIRFVPAPGGRGTEVHVEVRYAAPAGRIGVALAKLLAFEPGQQARADLRRLKQLLETGEVVFSDSSLYQLPHPARPPSDRFVEAAQPIAAEEAA
jgi:uncharacterized membrane protein